MEEPPPPKEAMGTAVKTGTGETAEGAMGGGDGEATDGGGVGGGTVTAAACVVVVAGAGERGRYIIDRKPRTAGSYPSTAAFAIEQNTIPSVAKLASRHRYPSIVEGNGGGVGGPRCNGRVCYVDGVLGIRKPIEHDLRADDEEAPEFVIDANLAAAQKRGVRCGAKRAAKRVCCAVSVIKTSAEIAADIEAGPVIGIGRSDRNVSGRGRRNRRRKVC